MLKRIVLPVSAALLCCLAACAPRVRWQKKTPVTGHVAGEVWLTQSPDSLPKAKPLGNLKVTQGLFTDSCTYPYIYNMLRKAARKRGGNLVYITGIRYPSTVNPCQALKAVAYTVDDPANYVSVIPWRPHVLKWDYFRAPGRPAEAIGMEAASFCKIEMELRSVPIRKPWYKVTPLFVPKKSWVAPKAKQGGLLKHEQGHFDLCEIEARRLRRSLDSLVKSTPGSITGVARALFKKHLQQYRQRGSHYDENTAHGTIDSAQQCWNEKIRNQLNNLREFAVLP